MAVGRFAPSPTGPLHLGNLRTALAAWLFARAEGSAFLVRMEDLDRVQASRDHERAQLRELADLGLDHDGEVVRQSERFDRYEAAIAELTRRGMTYPCYCTRREIREAATAPHADAAPEGAYPGTCRELSAAARAEREASERPPALRLRGPDAVVGVSDELLGDVAALVDDVVLRRNDGVPAYNLAVVVDDAAQGVGQVVRAADLASSSPRQRFLAELLDLPTVRYAHVPLVLGPDGQRLAKRDGAVTLEEQVAAGRSAGEVVAILARSLGLDVPEASVRPADLVARFDPARIARDPWTLPPELLTP
ncbi:MAG: tRNA glutamyl-Q(34) synthetase GluQRS [Acidimicrobiales bacterium]|nr:tRNA glutamyl-Q(34) synthetase GluQRS [Acidimicrobiales bacterium]HRW36653.1 tRNA glutamyl-Q(34) synthetase GluQRS [Aquihabitans sp.]